MATTTVLSPEDQEMLMRWPFVHKIPIFEADSVNKAVNLMQWSTMDFRKTDFRAEMLKGVYDKGGAKTAG